ncbi:Alkali-sensitive linkage protein 1 [Cytospora mali]|uniref:Alkali-sensitive linkage protein 1 n=1 Tax=Cytospora mali TaxID=578113 RepID=A0A194VC06_CYTMA|nr:Alkali-sensitive linkage protein 1 [Valsa mali var. pyri (nom. inval.)]
MEFLKKYVFLKLCAAPPSPTTLQLLELIAFSVFLMGILMADGFPASASKRGLGANDDITLTNFGGNGSQIVWQYNWDSNTANKQPFLEYVPMLWSIPGEPDVWNDHANTWISAGSSHLLAFNEPENEGQSNIDPTTAANAYRQYMQPFAGKAKLGAPAVSNDGYSWMSQFLGNCTDCTIDFVPIHWYNPVFLIDDFKSFTLEMCGLVGNRSIWVTEFMPLGNDSVTIEQFVQEAIDWLDEQDCVERYAYFGTADGYTSLLHNGGPPLSPLGKTYAFTPYGGGDHMSIPSTGGGFGDADGVLGSDECGG